MARPEDFKIYSLLNKVDMAMFTFFALCRIKVKTFVM